jgi:serine/threonine protein kinase/tetratricopeptide (TPR) repeat protein
MDHSECRWPRFVVHPPTVQPPPPQGRDPALVRAAALGRYIVLGLVGRGAMGEVYAAYDPELDRKVAIKLLRVRGDQAQGGTAHEGRARLMREAQAIAKLSHPNVVMVYDVGTFQGDVFIAMQFIDGQTLGYWMHAQPRAWPEIVKVFVEAGRGLAAAHEKNLIHRDFKPENVMVGADGHVRVMDFGLARATIDRDNRPDRAATEAAPGASAPAGPTDDSDPESTRALGSTARASRPTTQPVEPRSVQLTQTGAMLGTPAYMSPEQFQGLPIDPRADQFSFCVALYEALYGERPFAGNSLVSLMTGVLSGTVRDAPAGTKVPSRLRGLVVRGLRLKPDDRWPSLDALLTELERVGSPTRTPRRRFAAGAAAKLAGIWEAPPRGRAVETPAKAEIRRAFLATDRQYAPAAFDKVSLILDQYARDWSEMYVDACEATHVRGEQSAEVLDLRMASLDECLEGLAALCQALRQANAEVVENAVSAASALRSVDRCADVKLLRAVVRPPEDPTTRATVDRLRARVSEVRAVCQVGRFTEGLTLIAPLVDEVRRTGYGPLLAEALFEMGQLHSERRDAVAAALAFEEALWTAELGRHEEVAAKAAVQLIYAAGGAQLRFDAGEIWARYAETVLRRMGGQDVLWGWLFNNRGAMRERQGRLSEAVDDARAAVAANEKAHGPDSADVGMSLSNVAMYLEQMGDLEAAVSSIERGVRALESGLGPEHPRTGVILSNYAEILNQVGRFAEARQVARRALAIFERETRPDGGAVSYPLTALGLSNLGDGKGIEALPILEQAVAIRDREEIRLTSLGEAHFALARALHQTGQDIPRARALALRARSEYAEDSPSVLTRREITRINAWLADNDGSDPLPGEG